MKRLILPGLETAFDTEEFLISVFCFFFVGEEVEEALEAPPPQRRVNSASQSRRLHENVMDYL